MGSTFPPDGRIVYRNGTNVKAKGRFVQGKRFKMLKQKLRTTTTTN